MSAVYVIDRLSNLSDMATAVATPNNGDVLTYNSTTGLWTAVAPAGGAGGSNKQVQFNNSGVAGGFGSWTVETTTLSLGDGGRFVAGVEPSAATAHRIVASRDGSASSLSSYTAAASAVQGSRLLLAKSRGTTASPAAVNAEDRIGDVTWVAHGASGWSDAVAIVVDSPGAFTTTPGGRMALATRAPDGNLTSRALLSEAGWQILAADGVTVVGTFAPGGGFVGNGSTFSGGAGSGGEWSVQSTTHATKGRLTLNNVVRVNATPHGEARLEIASVYGGWTTTGVGLSETGLGFSDTGYGGSLVLYTNHGNLGPYFTTNRSHFRFSRPLVFDAGSAPDNSLILSGGCAMWVDPTNGASSVRLRWKDADGTIRDKTLAFDP